MHIYTVFTKIQPWRPKQNKEEILLASVASSSHCWVAHSVVQSTEASTRHLSLSPPSLSLDKILFLALARTVLQRQLWVFLSPRSLCGLARTRPFPPVEDSGRYGQSRYEDEDDHGDDACKPETRGLKCGHSLGRAQTGGQPLFRLYFFLAGG